MVRDKIVYVALEEIDRPKIAARDRVDPEKIRELAESIREIGLREPVLLRPVDGRYEIVAGDRRYLAHRLIGADKIKAIVSEASEEETILIRASENIQREDLSPMEKARIYLYMRKNLGFNVEKIAKRMGVRHETVTRYLGLLELEEEFQDAVNLGKLGMEVAYILSRVEDSDFRRYYLKAAVENGVTIEVAKRWLVDYENSRQAKFMDQGGGVGISASGGGVTVIYHTCAGCHGPVPSEQVRYFGLCQECSKKMERG